MRIIAVKYKKKNKWAKEQNIHSENRKWPKYLIKEYRSVDPNQNGIRTFGKGWGCKMLLHFVIILKKIDENLA